MQYRHSVAAFSQTLVLLIGCKCHCANAEIIQPAQYRLIADCNSKVRATFARKCKVWGDLSLTALAFAQVFAGDLVSALLTGLGVADVQLDGLLDVVFMPSVALSKYTTCD
jgi:hypothetical protein